MPMTLRSAKTRPRSASSPPSNRRTIVRSDNGYEDVGDTNSYQAADLDVSPATYPTLTPPNHSPSTSPISLKVDADHPLTVSSPTSDPVFTEVTSLGDVEQLNASSGDVLNSLSSSLEVGHEETSAPANNESFDNAKSSNVQEHYYNPSNVNDELELLLRASIPLPESEDVSVNLADDTPLQQPATLEDNTFWAPKKTASNVQLTAASSPSPPSKGEVKRYSFGNFKAYVEDYTSDSEDEEVEEPAPPPRRIKEFEPAPIKDREIMWQEFRDVMADFNRNTPNAFPMQNMDEIMREAYKMMQPQSRRQVYDRFKAMHKRAGEEFLASHERQKEFERIKSESANSIRASVATHATLNHSVEKGEPYPENWFSPWREPHTPRTPVPEMNLSPISSKRSRLPNMNVLQDRSLSANPTSATYGSNSMSWRVPETPNPEIRSLSPVASIAHSAGISNPNNYLSPSVHRSELENVIPHKTESYQRFERTPQSVVNDEWLEGTSAEVHTPRNKFQERSGREHAAREHATKIRHDRFEYPLPQYTAKLQLKQPSAYNGEADAHKFETWSYQVNKFFDMAGYPEHMCVRLLGNYLSGKAQKWYMSYVAPAPDKWTIAKIGSELFNYCFPDDLRRKLRKQFDSYNQGTRKLSDYVQELRTLGGKIPDIGERQICIRLFEGAIDKIRLRWIENGMTGEYTSLSDLENTGRQYESAIREAHRLEREIARESQVRPTYWNNQRVNNYNGNYSQNRQSGSQHSGRVAFSARRYNDRGSPRSTNPRGSNYSSHTGSGSNRNNYESRRWNLRSNAPDANFRGRPGSRGSGRPPTGGRSDRPDRGPLPQRPNNLDELRATNACFVCTKVGHLSRDCPERNQIPAPRNARRGQSGMRMGSATVAQGTVQIVPTTSKSPSDVITGAPLILKDGIAFDTNLPEPLNKKNPWGGYKPMTVHDVDRLFQERDRKAQYEAYRHVRLMKSTNKWFGATKMKVVQYNDMDGTLRSFATEARIRPDPLQIPGLPIFVMEDLKQIDPVNEHVYRFLYRTELYKRFEEIDGRMTLYLRRTHSHLPIVPVEIHDLETSEILHRNPKHWPLDVPPKEFPVDRLGKIDWSKKDKPYDPRTSATRPSSRNSTLPDSNSFQSVTPIVRSQREIHRVPVRAFPTRNRSSMSGSNDPPAPMECSDSQLNIHAVPFQPRRQQGHRVSFARNEPVEPYVPRTRIMRVPNRTPDTPGPSSCNMMALHIEADANDNETIVETDEYFHTDEVYDDNGTAVDPEMPGLQEVSDSDEDDGYESDSDSSEFIDDEIVHTPWGTSYIQTRGLNDEGHDMDHMEHLMRMLHINVSTFGIGGAYWFIDVPNSPRFGWRSYKNDTVLIFDYLVNMEFRFDYTMIRESHLETVIAHLEYFVWLRRDELDILEPELPFCGPWGPSDDEPIFLSGISEDIQNSWAAGSMMSLPLRDTPELHDSEPDQGDVQTPKASTSELISEVDPPVPSSSSVTLDHPMMLRQALPSVEHSDFPRDFSREDIPSLGWQQVFTNPNLASALMDNNLVERHNDAVPYLPIIPEDSDNPPDADHLSMNAIVADVNDFDQVPMSRMPSSARGINRSSLRVKDPRRIVPKVYTVDVLVNGQIVSALIDSGCQADVISKRLCDQLRLPLEPLGQGPITVLLASQGSRAVLENCTTVDFKFLQISRRLCCDVLSLDPAYDIILGTPFIWQHSLLVGLNPSRVSIGSVEPLPLNDKGKELQRINSVTMSALATDKLEPLRRQLLKECSDLCKAAEDTPLPPFRAVNHTIDLIDEKAQYKWIPSRCPRAWRPHWDQKRAKYIESGRWEFQSGSNASPMMFIAKKPGPGGEARMRTVVDKRAQNLNTVRRVSPLPNQEHILENTLSHPFRSLIDMRDAFEQIRVAPEHVQRTMFNTPEGTMVSLVMQQGDCNAVATFQTLMNNLFAPYLGVFMDVYLDDIIIYSDSIEDHFKHIRIVLNILRQEKFYLTTPDKLQFFAKELEILGHIVDDHGIKMDPKKVDTIMKWPTPTNKTLLSGFNGAVGYLAPNCYGVRIPMVILSTLAGAKSVWNWGPTEDRAFNEVKQTVHAWRDHHRVAPQYSKDAAPFNLGADASLMGGAGTLSQGADVETAKIIGFWSGKFNSAQQNYPVHERELLAIVESIKRFKHLLQGVHFRVYTDHRPLEHLLSQPNLSARQHRWLSFLSDFDFEIIYIPGKANILPDALSRIYSFDNSTTERTTSEFIVDDDERNELTLSALTNIAESDPASLRITRSKTNSLPAKSNRLDSANAAVLPLTDVARAALLPRSRTRKQRVAVTAVVQTPKSTETTIPDEVDPKEPSRIVLHDISNFIPMPENSVSQGEILDTITLNPNPEIEVFEPPAEFQTPTGGRVFSELDLPATKLLDIISLSDPDMRFPSCIQGRYLEDNFFGKIIPSDESTLTPVTFDSATLKSSTALPRHPNFHFIDGYLYLHDQSHIMLCIPDILVGTRKLREILISQAHSLLAHLGSSKTLAYLRESFWWPQMSKDVHSYCQSCSTCSISKPSSQKPYGLLRSLPVPSRPWQQIGIDFVGPLPLSRNRNGDFDMIASIIDHLTGMVHLVPMLQTYKAKDIAEMVFDSVYKLHGLPEGIVSDRDSYFTSTFWRRLHTLIGVDLRMSTAYHPQTDGVTERANRTCTQMLRQCVSLSQKDWAIKLPLIEYALNAARSDSTGQSPFFLNTGRRAPPMDWHIMPDEYRGVRVYAQRMHDALVSAHDTLIEKRVKSTILANKKRRPAPFKEGDLVYLSTVNLALPKGRSRKLSPKFLGPFLIEKEVVPKTSYRLALPSELKQKGIHPVFHGSLLRIHLPNDDTRFPGRELKSYPGFGDSDATWVIDNILSHAGSGENTLFEVHFKSGTRTWLPYREIKNTLAISDYLEAQGATTILELPNGSSVPPSDPEINPAAINVADPQIAEVSSNFLADSLETPSSLRISVMSMDHDMTQYLKEPDGSLANHDITVPPRFPSQSIPGSILPSATPTAPGPQGQNYGVTPSSLHIQGPAPVAQTAQTPSATGTIPQSAPLAQSAMGTFLDPTAFNDGHYDGFAHRRSNETIMSTSNEVHAAFRQMMAEAKDELKHDRELFRKEKEVLLAREHAVNIFRAETDIRLAKAEISEKKAAISLENVRKENIALRKLRNDVAPYHAERRGRGRFTKDIRRDHPSTSSDSSSSETTTASSTPATFDNGPRSLHFTGFGQSGVTRPSNATTPATNGRGVPFYSSIVPTVARSVFGEDTIMGPPSTPFQRARSMSVTPLLPSPILDGTGTAMPGPQRPDLLIPLRTPSRSAMCTPAQDGAPFTVNLPHGNDNTLAPLLTASERLPGILDITDRHFTANSRHASPVTQAGNHSVLSHLSEPTPQSRYGGNVTPEWVPKDGNDRDHD